MAKINIFDEQVTLITGGAGEIGQVVAQRYLEQGACVILTGRTEAKLKLACDKLSALDPSFISRLFYRVMDSSNISSLESGFAWIKTKFGRVDILINNAGTAGSLRPLVEIPTTRAQLTNLVEQGGRDRETLTESILSLLGSPWLTTLQCLPLLTQAARVINVSTIFSRTEYFGRIPYVVPKAALNSLSQEFAQILGQDKRAIRVNTIYPGPVESDRIRNVFAEMDRMKEISPGTTQTEILKKMTLRPEGAAGALLSKDEIAATIVFLGSNESSGLASQDIAVTHGLKIPSHQEISLVERPNLGQTNYGDRLVWIMGGKSRESIQEFAQAFLELGATILATPAHTLLSTQQIEALQADGLVVVPLTSEGLMDKTAKDFMIGSAKTNLSIAILPTTEIKNYGNSVTDVDPTKVIAFLESEIAGVVHLAKEVGQTLEEQEARWLKYSVPSILFAPENAHDENPLCRIRAAAIHALIRVWRHEREIMSAQLKSEPWQIYQVTMRSRPSEGVAKYVNEWLVWLLSGLANFSEIDLSIVASLSPSVNNTLFRENLKAQNVCGLHSNRVALITGGSEGIGGEISRHLIMSGARIVIAERHNDKLLRMQETLCNDCRLHGYNDPESRLMIIPGVDVCEGGRMKDIIKETVARFGRIDFIVNNAGLSGAEQMVIDMPRALWEKTLTGNFVSNYRLLLDGLPYMKQQGSGHIINMSSYFGGSRHGWVPYTNRADYAVSKYGQIALAEAFAPFIGPDVQINAIAPGPVDGARLNGRNETRGLYFRRSKLVLENKLLNALHASCIAESISGTDLLGLIAENNLPKLLDSLSDHAEASSFKPIFDFFRNREKRGFTQNSNAYIDGPLFKKLLQRLGIDKNELALINPSQELFTEEEIQQGANQFRDGILTLFALGKMPVDADFALSVVWSLAQRMLTGEVLYPNNGFRYGGGLQLSASFRSDGLSLLPTPRMRAPIAQDKCVLLLGNSMFEKMAQIAGGLAKQKIGSILIVVGDAAGRTELKRFLTAEGVVDSCKIILEESGDPERAFTSAQSQFGNPHLVISFPWSALVAPSRNSENPWRDLPSLELFSHFVETHLTNHFLVAQKSSMISHCHVVLITANHSAVTNSLERALADLFAKTLRPLTLAAGSEAKHLPHSPEFYQIDGGLNGDEICSLIYGITDSLLSKANTVEKKAA